MSHPANTIWFESVQEALDEMDTREMNGEQMFNHLAKRAIQSGDLFSANARGQYGYYLYNYFNRFNYTLNHLASHITVGELS